MAQLYFKYGAMGSSKTANALMARFNYEERGQKTLLVKPRMDQRDGDHMVHSRIGLEYPCVYFDEMRALSEDALKENACIIVDEAQFLSKEEVDYLVHVVDDLGVPVICYGLRADFKGELFPGSYELLVMADKLEEVKTICWCGKKAMFNARFDENGKVLKEGAQVVLGANDKYIGLCRRHWRASGPGLQRKGYGRLMICNLCPRRCGVERTPDKAAGVCAMPAWPVAARAMLHQWEEPCLVGERGAGAVFFSGCNLRCKFCQNGVISQEGYGKPITPRRLREIFEELVEQGAACLDLVTPTHFTDAVLEALGEERWPVPVVWNCGGYESVETLKRLENRVQVYLPDLKYALTEPAKAYSGAADYPETAKAAILEMFRQTGLYRMENGQLRSGVLIRHLVLPGELENTKAVIDWVAETFRPGEVLFSLMSQYTPQPGAEGKLARRVTKAEYRAAERYMADCGIADGFTQERTSAKEEYTPDFHLQGI